MAIIFILISFSIHIIQDFRDPFLILISGREVLGYGRFATTLTAITIFIVLLIVGRIFPLRKICYTVFLSFPLFIAIWGLLIVPFNSLPAAHYWPEIIYYIGTSLWVGGAFFFFWSFANNHFSFRQAAFYYPYLISISLLIHFPINTILQRYLMDKLTNFSGGALYIKINIILLCLGIVIFGIFSIIDYRLPRIKHALEKRTEDVNKLFGLNYRLIIGLLFFCISFLFASSHRWLDLTAHLKYQTAIEYQPLKASIASFINYTGFVSIAFLAALSFLLYDRKGSGWRAALSIITFILSLSSFVWYILLFMGLDISYLIDAGLTHHIVITFLLPIIFLLKEMSFIVVPKKIRFITKTWVDLFFRTIGFYTPEAIITLFTWFFGTVFNAIPYMFIITVLILAVLLSMGSIAGKRIQIFSP